MAREPESLFERLRRVSPFDGLGVEDLGDLEADLRAVGLEPGAMLVEAGGAGDSVYVLLAGRLVVHAGGAPERVFAELTPGAVVGELSAITGEHRSASVRAVDACELAEISGRVFRALVAGHPDAFGELLHRAAETSRQTKLLGH